MDKNTYIFFVFTRYIGGQQMKLLDKKFKFIHTHFMVNVNQLYSGLSKCVVIPLVIRAFTLNENALVALKIMIINRQAQN